jgi:hypothetical protein
VILRPTLVLLSLVGVVACSADVELTVSTTQLSGDTTVGPASSGDMGERIHAWASLQDDLDPAASELPLLVTHTGCAGGLIPEEVESVEVEETEDNVRIAVFIRLPPAPYPTTCPANPEIEHTITLDSPIGQRTVELLFGDESYVLWPIEAPESDLVQRILGDWELVSAESDELKPEGEAGLITIEFTETGLAGVESCAPYQGSYHLDGNTLKLDHIETTAEGCGDWTDENPIMRFPPEDSTIAFEDDRLVLSNSTWRYEFMRASG